MRITSTGNVGIGTRSPGAPLEVYVTRTSSTNATSIILSDNVTGAQTNGVYKSIKSISNGSASQSEIRFLESDGTNNNTSIAFATANTAGGITERMRVLNTGNVLCLAGGNTAATGTGIAFPSSINTSSDPNTLDDYEEGTWTPVFGGTTTNPTVTYSAQVGTYTIIGNRVIYEITLLVSAASGGSGALTVSLPFATSSSSNNYHVCVVGYSDCLQYVVKTGYTDPGRSDMFLTPYDSAGSNIPVTALTNDGSGYLMMQGQYLIG
jgi:hypothetical protein